MSPSTASVTASRSVQSPDVISSQNPLPPSSVVFTVRTSADATPAAASAIRQATRAAMVRRLAPLAVKAPIVLQDVLRCQLDLDALAASRRADDQRHDAERQRVERLVDGSRDP